ncbi:hypothetical protein [Natrarchaeobaculum sulfurireducens]|uniref:Uncharacterized protein n=1 Tax=Natrarchaeobaculum sulfurireducens TaxID=2044521 RepID=A0A346PUL6_9EURY|nr:hypothetical protein [Natrarchaeobaculum sulfurireducens]AXR79441.1 hypothetical protein AArc1_3135 [Natrarchaeobaculum sulfurireducens]AXR83211.1 hypothetical protein AArcMg_3226 [Natrarchaeobaculum sulfurireducens]
MTLDRHAAERRRFARLLGVDGTLGSGLPIGTVSRRRRTEHRPEKRRRKESLTENERRAGGDQIRDHEDSQTDAECDRA